ncbi:DegQ family serine endoprotease [Aestuariicella hydrocarbonica]|uniref:Probable periplasmic serine endoprotease DegP-like n=1 Tax=Pseudomaricurvus hydrocarbonicus TaxID=1470433 RepID=A0A9E5JVZ8_9GAMM|nr:DegQ family serine endoprotease [Aestuariicella hydrocarbonica]NHO65550.1 DegQ family serine endoprotease [Aestuariicella hydrocarbonica]
MTFKQFYLPFFLLVISLGAQARSGLPDFTDLIESTSPAVVKINTVEHVKARGRMQLPPGRQDVPDIFRHLFEPPGGMPERNVQSMGSGFIVSADGYILTNNHVVDGADEIQVRLSDRREYSATVVGSDERSDLALLKVDATGLPTLKFAKDDDLKVGQWVLAIGSPFGLDFSASAGIVSAIGRSIPSERNENYVPFIQTDVAINPGNSGGPLFNLDGEVVGINSQIYTRSGGSIGLSFAIPVSVAREVVSQLKEKGRVDRGWLGVVIQEVDRDLAASFGLSKPMGALVAQMDPRGPAAKSGIQVGDVIIKFDGMTISTSGDLPHAVGGTPPGETVPVTVIREGKKTNIPVTVGTLGGDAAAASKPVDSIDGGRLGLVVEPVDEQTMKEWQLAGGVVVTKVLPNEPGAKAGLRPGDIIVQLGFNDVASVQEFSKIVAQLPPNNLLPIRFYRHGRALFRTISIAE